MRQVLPIVCALILATPALAVDDAKDPSIHGRNYTSHRSAGNTAFEAPGGFHGNLRHGREIGAHWDRTWPPNGFPGFAGTGRRTGRVYHGNAPWPLSNLDIEVQAE